MVATPKATARGSKLSPVCARGAPERDVPEVLAASFLAVEGLLVLPLSAAVVVLPPWPLPVPLLPPCEPLLPEFFAWPTMA